MRFLLLALLSAAAVAQSPSTYIPTTIAGIGMLPYASDGHAATTVDLFDPRRVAVDRAGNVYFSEAYYGRVLKISVNGSLSTAASGGTTPWSDVEGIALDAAGSLYVGADYRLWKVAPDGVARALGGTGVDDYTGDGAAATDAAFSTPWAITVDSAGNVYFCDNTHHVIRRIGSDGRIATVAGTGVAGYSGDGQAANTARLYSPQDVVADGAGGLYIADTRNYRIRRVSASGVISTVAGNGAPGGAIGEGVAAASTALYQVYAMTSDTSGNLYFTGSRYGEIHRLETSTGLIYSASHEVQACNGLASISTGSLVALDFLRRTVYRISLPDGRATLLAGTVRTSAIGDGGAASQALFLYPSGLALDRAGNVWAGDWDDQRIRRIDATGKIVTVAGTGIFGSSGDNGPATAAQIAQPRALVVDSAGILYFSSACQIRRVRADGVLEVFAGNGTCGYSEPPGAVSAMLNFPGGVAVDTARNLYVADTSNHRLRKVTSGGTIQTIAGSGRQGYAGNNGADALSASMDTPVGIALDSKGSVYFADSLNHRVRRITGGGIYDVAGNGHSGNDGDGGAATAARLCSPQGLAIDASDNLYIASCGYIRRVGPEGKISTIAGSGDLDFSGDGDLATSAGMDPYYVAVDGRGRVYFSDGDNRRVRRLDPAQIFPSGVVNGATFLSGAVAPGEIVTIYGAGLGPAQLAQASLDPNGPPLDTRLAGVQVTFDGVAAPLLYVSAGQVGAVVPFSVSGKENTVMQAAFNGTATNLIRLPVSAASPGLFTAASSGKGQASMLNQDWSINSTAKPAAAGDVVMLYGTGGGLVSPARTDGSWTVSADSLAGRVSVTIGGVDAPVIYAGSAPGMVAGVFQINAVVPQGVGPGNATVTVKVGTAVSPGAVTMAVR